MENQRVININKGQRQSYSLRGSQKQCVKLIPYKDTFLNSNQLITKYVTKGNVKTNILTTPRDQVLHHNSYELGKAETATYQIRKQQKNLKYSQINNQIKMNSQKIYLQLDAAQNKDSTQVKTIQLMVQNIHAKAADIMNGRNNSTYMRKQTINNQIALKQMKHHTTQKTLRRIQATRKSMVNKSHKYIQKAIVSHDNSLVNATLTQQCSLSSSLLSASTISNQIVKKTRKTKNESLIKKLLKARSFESLYQAKRRNAASEAFALCWQLGVKDKKLRKANLFEVKQKENASIRRPRKTNGVISQIQKIGSSQKCELAQNKKYFQAFQNKVDNFRIVEKV